MQQLPHQYLRSAEGRPTGTITTRVDGLETLEVAAPKQFDGPGDKWSPEDMLVACAADCLILTFRAIATASKLEWVSLTCDAKGTLDSVERVTRFTELHLTATLKIGPDESPEKATKLLEKAEQVCLVTNSLSSQVHLSVHIA